MTYIVIVLVLAFVGLMGWWLKNELRHPDKSVGVWAAPIVFSVVALVLPGLLLPEFWKNLALVVVALAIAAGLVLLMIQQAHRDLNPGGK